MTLVLAMRLSDRTYIAADTRVTELNQQTGETTYSDNNLKVEILNSKLVVACAGKLRFIGHALRWLRNRIDEDTGIDDLKSILDEDFKDVINRYMADPLGGQADVEASLLFGGVQLDKQDILSVNMVSHLASRNQKLQEEAFERLIPLLSNLENGKPWSLENPQEKIDFDFVFGSSASPALTQALEQSMLAPISSITSNNIKIRVFAMDVHHTTGIEFNECDYGKLIKRGDGERGEASTDDIIARLEMNKDREDRSLANSTLIQEIAERFSKSVGGCVTVFEVMPDGVRVICAPEILKVGSDGTTFFPGTDVLNDQLVQIKLNGDIEPLIQLSESPLSQSRDAVL
jgi:hypothetical protein